MIEKSTINCEEALKHVFEYIDRALAKDKLEGIEHHLSICRSCYSRVEFERQLKGHLGEVGQQSAPETLQKRVQRLIKKF